MNTLVWITFPTVDIVNPEEDEIVERLARLLHERRLKGEFLFSGVKVQSTLENRPATIDCLNKTNMTIGYQGNAHSLHPGLMEYEEKCDWEEGVVEATRRETGWISLDGTIDPGKRGGILLLQDTFGEHFTGFRGAGGWTPQVMEVLRQNSICVHHTLFDLAEATGHTMVSYLGSLQISPGRSKWTGDFPYDSPLTNRLEVEQIVRHPAEGITKFAESFERMVDNYSFRGPRILFVNFHPFFLFTDTIGDVINHSNGYTPEPPDNLVRSNPLPKAEMERRWNVIQNIFDWLSERSDVAFVTSADFVEKSKSLQMEVTKGEIEMIAEIVAHLPIMRPPAFIEYDGKNISLAETFDLFQRALWHYHQHVQLPDRLHTNFRHGPSDIPSPKADRIAVASTREVMDAALAIPEEDIPTEVLLGDGPIAPYPFLIGMARVLLWRDDPIRTILIRPTEYVFPELAESFNVYLRRCADWQIYRRHLDPSRIERHASLQLWTYKPLV